MLKEKDKETIDKIIKDFDFVKVQGVMGFMDWGWAFEPSPPSIRSLEDTARRILKSVIEYDEDGYCSTGGFTATRKGNDLFLDFVIESSEERFRTDREIKLENYLNE